MTLMTAGWTVWRGAGRAAWTAGGAAACGTPRTHGRVSTFSDFGHYFAGFFRLAFRADGVWLLAQTQRYHFKLLFAFITLIFINRHNFKSLACICFNLDINKGNVNTCKAIRPEIVHWHTGAIFLYCATLKASFHPQIICLWKGSYEGKR